MCCSCFACAVWKFSKDQGYGVVGLFSGLYPVFCQQHYAAMLVGFTEHLSPANHGLLLLVTLHQQARATAGGASIYFEGHNLRSFEPTPKKRLGSEWKHNTWWRTPWPTSRYTRNSRAKRKRYTPRTMLGPSSRLRSPVSHNRFRSEHAASIVAGANKLASIPVFSEVWSQSRQWLVLEGENGGIPPNRSPVAKELRWSPWGYPWVAYPSLCYCSVGLP